MEKKNGTFWRPKRDLMSILRRRSLVNDRSAQSPHMDRFIEMMSLKDPGTFLLKKSSPERAVCWLQEVGREESLCYQVSDETMEFFMEPTGGPGQKAVTP